MAKERLNKSPRHGEWVDLKSGERTIKAFVVYPESKNKTPAVLVIHEIFGLTDWVRSVADQLAEAGYIAITPDLLSGMGPKGGGTSDFSGEGEVRRAIMGLNEKPDQVTAVVMFWVDGRFALPNVPIAVNCAVWPTDID